jgi:hypothetical protein
MGSEAYRDIELSVIWVWTSQITEERDKAQDLLDVLILGSLRPLVDMIPVQNDSFGVFRYHHDSAFAKSLLANSTIDPDESSFFVKPYDKFYIHPSDSDSVIVSARYMTSNSSSSPWVAASSEYYRHCMLSNGSLEITMLQPSAEELEALGLGSEDSLMTLGYFHGVGFPKDMFSLIASEGNESSFFCEGENSTNMFSSDTNLTFDNSSYLVDADGEGLTRMDKSSDWDFNVAFPKRSSANNGRLQYSNTTDSFDFATKSAIGIMAVKKCSTMGAECIVGQRKGVCVDLNTDSSCCTGSYVSNYCADVMKNGKLTNRKCCLSQQCTVPNRVCSSCNLFRFICLMMQFAPESRFNINLLFVCVLCREVVLAN